MYKYNLGRSFKDVVGKHKKNIALKFTKSHMISYEKYFQGLTEKEQLKITEKDKYTTFLVFHSGNVIMSGLDKPHMESTFNEFITIINECKSSIEEKLTSEK